MTYIIKHLNLFISQHTDPLPGSDGAAIQAIEYGAICLHRHGPESESESFVIAASSWS